MTLSDRNSTVFTADGLPGGLFLDPHTGKISGTPTESGQFHVNVTATKQGVFGAREIVIEVAEADCPVIFSPLSATANVGSPFSYLIQADKSPVSFDCSGLPEGLHFYGQEIRGVPTREGVSEIKLSASNSGGTATELLTLTVLESLPVIQSPLYDEAVVGAPYSYRVVSAHASEIVVDGIPSGLAYSEGLISGSFTSEGSYALNLHLSNGGGVILHTLLIKVSPRLSKEPSLSEKAKSLLSSVGNWAAKGFPVADEDLVSSRLEICNACPHWNPRGFGGTGKCTACGCSTQAKLTMKTSVCPEGKW